MKWVKHEWKSCHCKCWLIRIKYGSCPCMFRSIYIYNSLELIASLSRTVFLYDRPFSIFILMSALHCRPCVGLYLVCDVELVELWWTFGPQSLREKVQYQEWKHHSSPGPHKNRHRQPATPREPTRDPALCFWIIQVKNGRRKLQHSPLCKQSRSNLQISLNLVWQNKTFPLTGPDVPLVRNPSMEHESSDGQHPSCCALTEWNVDAFNLSYISTLVRRGSCVGSLRRRCSYVLVDSCWGILVVFCSKRPLLSELAPESHHSTTVCQFPSDE